MPFFIVKKDITDFDTDAIVNSANSMPLIGEGVEASIYSKAGTKLLDRRKAIGEIPLTESRISDGYNLMSKYVIHSVAPTYENNPDFTIQLGETYLNALKLAVTYNLESIAFPLLASGTNGCPRQTAIEIAIDTINRFLGEYELDIYLVLYKPFRSGHTASVSSMLRRFFRERDIDQRRIRSASSFKKMAMMDIEVAKSIDDLEINRGKSFRDTLLEIIIEKDYSNVRVYKKANINKRLFSKMMTKPEYKPSKNTVLALCVSLKLPIKEAEALLQTAGYSLSEGIESDVIVRFCIEHKIYDILEINIVLHEYGHPPLGSQVKE